MKSLSIEFHATDEEIIQFITRIYIEFSLHAVLLNNTPFTIEKVTTGKLESILIKACSELEQKTLVLFILQPDLNAARKMEFFDHNDGGIVIDIGRLTPSGLEQSILSIKTNDEKSFVLAKKISNLLKKITHLGVTAINPSTGAKAVIKSARYTDGALSLENKGVKMLPFAGGCELKLGI